MITQKLLDDIKAHEEYFFSFSKLAVPPPPPPKHDAATAVPTAGVKVKGGVVREEAPLRPEQVDKIVKQALNRLKVKQDQLKKRNSNLTPVAAEVAKEGKMKGKRKAAKGEGGEGEAEVNKKRKKVDKKDKKERRKVELKGRSAKKDAKNKAAKGGEAGDEAASSKADAAEADKSGSDPADGKAERFLFGKIETAAAGGKKQMGKDFKKHLKNLQEEKSKIAQAKGEDLEKGEALEEKFAWKNVMQKAQGVKVKDDEGLIKKSIKRKENIKKHSQKKWEKRDKEVKEKMAEKQQKRTTNIRAKKDEKIKKKVKKMTKKGRLVPGLNAPGV